MPPPPLTHDAEGVHVSSRRQLASNQQLQQQQGAAQGATEQAAGTHVFELLCPTKNVQRQTALLIMLSLQFQTGLMQYRWHLRRPCHAGLRGVGLQHVLELCSWNHVISPRNIARQGGHCYRFQVLNVAYTSLNTTTQPILHLLRCYAGNANCMTGIRNSTRRFTAICQRLFLHLARARS
jgi:hypothetical protein